MKEENNEFKEYFPKVMKELEKLKKYAKRKKKSKRDTHMQFFTQEE